MNQLKLMGEQRFIDHIYDGYKASQRYCFILGASASKTSGIRTGEELMQEWRDFFIKRGENYIHECADELGLALNEYENIFKDNYKLQNDDYFTLFDLRFAGQANAAFAFLENEMVNKYPSYGYYPLSMILSNTQNKLVITTNFDSLVEDALFIYKLQHPLVVGHESLASYIVNDSRRPVVAKIHRDLLFKPMNRKEDMNKIQEEWKLPLTTALAKYIPIVIGYAGGDKTLMSLLNEIQLQGIYWCYVGEKPSESICNIIRKHDGYLVKIQGFDEILFLLGERFHSEANFNDPCKYIREQSEIRCQLYQDSFERIAGKYKKDDQYDQNNQISPNKINDELKNLHNAFTQYCKRQDISNIKIKNMQVSIKKLMLLNKNDEALEICNRLIEIQPMVGNNYYMRSQIFQKINILEKALADASMSIRLVQDNAHYYSNRGAILHGLKRFDQALADKTTAIELNPQEPYFYFSRNVTFYELGKLDKALADADSAINLDSSNPIYYDSRSTTLYEMGELDRALADACKAIELDPDNPRFYYSRSAVYHKLGCFQEAKKDSLIANSLKPKSL